MAASPKTRPTDADPRAYCAELPTTRRQDEGARLIEMFEEITGKRAVMWGPSIIGCGDVNDWPVVGFSPRKAAISFYGLVEKASEKTGASDSADGGEGGSDDNENDSAAGNGSPQLLARLGKHRLGKGCLYVNGLNDVDESVLRELIAAGWETGQ